MKIISMTFIVAITILALFLSPIQCKTGGGGSGGGGAGGGGFMGGRGFVGSGSPSLPGGMGAPVDQTRRNKNGERVPVEPPPELVTGYRGGKVYTIENGGGLTPAMVGIPGFKYYPDPAKPAPIPLPTGKPGNPVIPPLQQPKCGRGPCINKYIYGGVGGPKQASLPCCAKFKLAIHCLCKYIQSGNTKRSDAAYAIVKGCRIPRPDCPKPASKLYRHN